MTIFIHHAAQNEARLPLTSLAALESCLRDEVKWVEVDIIPLADGDFALLHDVDLAHASDGQGMVYEQTAETIREVHYLDQNGKPSPYPIGTLRQAVALLQEQEGQSHLQLDLKPFAPLSGPVLQSLLGIIQPVKERILISSVADWAVRALYQMDQQLALGFDPLLYLDLETEQPRPEGIPPLRVGAYGYRDEHPLSIQRWGAAGAYFAARAEALVQQVPPKVTWFINARLLDEARQAGFEWIRYLHQLGFQVDAWTLDSDRVKLARQLIAEGVDFITSNQVAHLAAVIPHNSI